MLRCSEFPWKGNCKFLLLGWNISLCKTFHRLFLWGRDYPPKNYVTWPHLGKRNIPWRSLTARPWKVTFPIGKDHLPTTIFQGRAVELREGNWGYVSCQEGNGISCQSSQLKAATPFFQSHRRISTPHPGFKCPKVTRRFCRRHSGPDCWCQNKKVRWIWMDALTYQGQVFYQLILH